MKILLWDIDGTLIRSGSKLYPSSHLVALEHVKKIKKLKDKTFHGATDSEVILCLAEYNNIKISKNELKRILFLLDRVTVQKMSKEKKSTQLVLPGIREILRDTASYGYKHGIVTGNTNNRARAKLEATDIYSFFSSNLFFCGGNYYSRSEFVETLKSKLIYEKLFLIGDTPNDIMAAKENNLKIIAVATGHFDIRKLNSMKPDLVISNFKSHKDLFLNYINTIE